MPLSREQARLRVARLRQEWIAEHGPCAECGTWEPPLEVDHVDPSTKAFTVYFSEGRARREAELAKCQVLCAPCHLAKTKRDRGIITHCPQGHEYTPENTRHHGDGKSCRTCQRDLNRRWMREYRSRVRSSS